MTNCLKSTNPNHAHGWDLKGATDTASVEQCHWCGAYRIEDKYPTYPGVSVKVEYADVLNYIKTVKSPSGGPPASLWWLVEAIFDRIKEKYDS